MKAGSGGVAAAETAVPEEVAGDDPAECPSGGPVTEGAARVCQPCGPIVAGGMLASTFLSIVFIPVLYVAIRTIAPGKTRAESSAGL